MMPETEIARIREELAQLQRENRMFRRIMQNIVLNTNGSDNLTLEQARWKLSLVNQIAKDLAG